MLKKGQRPLPLLKPDAERYVDIVDLGQTQAVTVPDPPDPVTPAATAPSLFALALNCSSFSSSAQHCLIMTPQLCSHMHIGTNVSKVTFWTFASYCQFHHA